jgi:hypothetical protein
VPLSEVNYALEVDEGFIDADTGLGFFTNLTNQDNNYTTRSFVHKNLIMGHTYMYRIKA